LLRLYMNQELFRL